jgi:hypothetical protein
MSLFIVPAVVVNNYLWDMMRILDPTADRYEGVVPFFPLGDSAAGAAEWNNKPYFVYDRMYVVNKSPFYPTKKEQIHYALKGNESEVLVWGSALQFILDREDDAGKDINEWIRNNGGNEAYPIFFHHARIYQTKSAVSTAGAQRDFSINQHYVSTFHIEIEYHHTTTFDEAMTKALTPVV